MSQIVASKLDNMPVPESHEVSISGGATFCFFKRVMDIVLSLIAFIVLLIPMVIIAVIIRLDTPGPVIFKQERLGLNRKPFVMYKFRSMYINAEENGPQWAKKDDSRVTKVGRFLRNTRLDELPQLWNIIRGEMSIVGPRPEREYFYGIFEARIPYFGKRMLVKPGLTGWAQVNGGYELMPEQKIEYDLEYICNRSLKIDIICILKTFNLVFTKEGAR
ncbi:MAG: exopolysaccharide biosynthesis polyprenyl glycosylphosphotransferase [Oscillospiraceae bacterium]|nr:exopolysaccharide biosynthesis polyprenyl glycosylphosphotransferase [Oscillospiraceae bacterium]